MNPITPPISIADLQPPASAAQPLGDFFLSEISFEIKNRAFAREVMQRITPRYQGQALTPFWQAYLDLELFSEQLYLPWVQRWQLTELAGWRERWRGRLFASTPRHLMPAVLRAVRKMTAEYLNDITKMQEAAPAEAEAFMRFVWAQEQLQVELMDCALAGDAERCPTILDNFIAALRRG